MAQTSTGSGSRLPLFGIAAVVLALAVVTVGVVGGLLLETPKPKLGVTSTSAPSASVAAVPAKSMESDFAVAQLFASAAAGDPEAIQAIERRDPKRRSGAEWVALARGRIKLEKFRAALQAYGKALDADPSLARDRTLLGHVRKAADATESAEEALRMAAYRLGSEGADLLYHVWVATRARTATTQLARQLVYSEDVRAKASPALSVALSLREGDSCEHFKKLLPGATLHGDTRAHRVLKPLLRERGCGVRKRDDCYPCLRADTALADAVAAVKVRPEPLFLVR